jgi:hypothetical protein
MQLLIKGVAMKQKRKTAKQSEKEKRVALAMLNLEEGCGLSITDLQGLLESNRYRDFISAIDLFLYDIETEMEIARRDRSDDFIFLYSEVQALKNLRSVYSDLDRLSWARLRLKK